MSTVKPVARFEGSTESARMRLCAVAAAVLLAPFQGAASTADSAPQAIASEATPVVTLRAFRDTVTYWRLGLAEPRPGICLFTPRTGELKYTLPATPSPKRCATLLALAADVVRDVKAEQAFAQSYPPEPSADSPTYELLVGEIRIPVRFDGPQECDVAPSGKLTCRKNDLSPGQKLMLELRAWAQWLQEGLKVRAPDGP
jgi:hypothetical protein